MKTEDSNDETSGLLFYQSDLEDFYDNFADFLTTYPMTKPSSKFRMTSSTKNHVCDLKAAVSVYHKDNAGCTPGFSYFSRCPTTSRKKLLVRLYILQAENLPALDFATQMSDPYLYVRTSGGETFGKREDFVTNSLDPMFGVCFEFKVNLPVDYLVRVEVWNHNKVLKDELIGYTDIDIENRYLNRHLTL